MVVLGVLAVGDSGGQERLGILGGLVRVGNDSASHARRTVSASLQLVKPIWLNCGQPWWRAKAGGDPSFNCHTLRHEDLGRMGQFLVVPGDRAPNRIPDAGHHVH